jgi:hypothetical protein
VANILPIEIRRVEFRVICKDQNGTELKWKITETLKDAVDFVDRLEPRFRQQCEWLVFEVAVAESARVVHRIPQLS